MKLYYVLEWRDDYESFSPLYITSNKEKSIAWWSRNNDESLGYFIACKNQVYDDVFCKTDLDDSCRSNNYFAGLWQFLKSMTPEEFMDRFSTDYLNKDPEIIDLDELQKDDNQEGIKYFSSLFLQIK